MPRPKRANEPDDQPIAQGVPFCHGAAIHIRAIPIRVHAVRVDKDSLRLNGTLKQLVTQDITDHDE